MTSTILSLTTIPSRFSAIGPTLESLLAQRASIDRIILWIPERYRRGKVPVGVLLQVPAGVELLRCPIDYGPATKVLPTVKMCRGQDVRILYCDDDQRYHPDWAGHLLAASDAHPDACIAAAGTTVRELRFRAFRASQRYCLLQVASLGLYKRLCFGDRHRLADNALDIASGFGGVVVRPDFFAPAAFDIPDALWTVDDVWLSGCLRAAGVPIRLAPGSPAFGRTAAAGIDALLDLVHDGSDRGRANVACMDYFAERYGIWRQHETAD